MNVSAGSRKLVVMLAHWLYRPIPMHRLAVTRILLGLSLAAAYLLRWREFETLFQEGSVAWFGPFRTYLSHLPRLPFNPLVVTLPVWAGDSVPWLLAGGYWLLVVAAVLFAVGCFTRTSGVVALFVHSWFLTLNPLAFWGWAVMLQPFLLYVLFTPSGRAWSVDALRRPNPTAITASAWPVRLLQVHVCMMYAEAGFSRLDSKSWQRGEMLFQALSDTTVTRFAVDWHAFAPMLQVFSYAVWILEPAAVFLLWPRRTRRIVAWLLVAMHVGLELLSRVGMWNFVMIAGLVPFLMSERSLKSGPDSLPAQRG